MKTFSFEELIELINSRADECGYVLCHSNEPYMNHSRIEAMKAHYQQMLEKCDIPCAEYAIPTLQRVGVKQYFRDLEKKYLAKTIH